MRRVFLGVAALLLTCAAMAGATNPACSFYPPCENATCAEQCIAQGGVGGGCSTRGCPQCMCLA